MKIEDIVDLRHRTMNMIQTAQVVEVNPETARVRVQLVSDTSPWLRWCSQRASSVVCWDMPELGEEVLILCLQGDLEQAICLPALFNLEIPPPSQNPREHFTLYADGAMVGYNDETHALYARLPEGGSTELVSDGGITVTGDITVTGNVTVNGSVHSTQPITTDASVTASGDVSDGAGSLQANRGIYNGHKHTDSNNNPTSVPDTQQ